MTVVLFDDDGRLEQAVEFIDGLPKLLSDPETLLGSDRLQVHLRGVPAAMADYLQGERTFPEIAGEVQLLNGGIGALMVLGGILFHPALPSFQEHEFDRPAIADQENAE